MQIKGYYSFFGKVIFFLALPFLSVAQNQQPSNVSMVPPSPNAAAFNKYIDLPVNTYTGIPSITVPLYEIRVGSFVIPISLSYHAGGHKLEDVATWVGLGWSLTGTYQISRSMAGLPDESPQGFMNAPPVLTYSPSANEVENYNKIRRYVDLLEDSEPDFFYFNAHNTSGKFVFDKETKRPNFIPYQKIRLDYSVSNEAIASWTLINSDGIKFNFDKTESTTTTPVNQRSGSTTQANSTWWVSQISFQDKNDKIHYEYEPHTISYLQGVSHSSFYKLTPSFHEKPDIYSHNRQVNEILLPKKIFFPGGQIDFITNNEQDPQRCDVSGGRYLKEIIVRNVTGQIVKHYQLEYNYFSENGSVPLSFICQQGSQRDGLRLKLKSISEVTDPAHPQITRFDYEESINLPNRITSFARDHWGFYNGQVGNYTLIPAVKTLTNNAVPIELDGANREPSESHTKANVLTKITYPTGGYSNYEYEQNDCENARLPNNYISQSITLGVTAANQTTSITVRALTWASRVVISPLYLPEVGNLRIRVIRENDGQLLADNRYVNTRGNVDSLLPMYVDVFPAGGLGKYNIQCDYIGDALNPSFDFLGIAWKDEELRHKKPVGGLRVKRTRMHSSNTESPDLITTYSYANKANSQLSSGRIIDVPGYDHIYMFNFTTYLARTSMPNNDLGFVQGSPVGYQFVTVKQIDTTGNINGSTEYEYSTVQEYPEVYYRDSEHYPFVPASYQNEWRRGQLLSKKIYRRYSNDSLTLVSEVRNTYKGYSPYPTLFNDRFTSYGKQIDAAKAYIIHDYQFGIPPTDTRTIVLNKYPIYTGSYNELIQTVEKQYHDNEVVVMSKTYQYDTVTLQVRSEEMLTSKNQLQSILFYYPTDFVQHPVFDSMVKRNMIAPVVKQTKSLNGQLLDTRINTFILSIGLIHPQYEEYALSTNAPYKLLTYDNYDSEGDLLQYTSVDGVTKSLVWGYEHLLPIAEVINSSSNNIAATSFELHSKGNWLYDNNGNSSLHGSITGISSFLLSTGSIQRTGLHINTPYIVSYWLKDSFGGTVNIGGTPLMNKNGWTLYQTTITGVESITISGSALIDELRLYPLNAQMTTYTYEPLVGMTSQCDPNNRIIYYEYDAFGRLKVIRDQDMNIIKTFNYNYKQ